MKSSKSPRIGLTPRSRSSRSSDSHGAQPSPTLARQPPESISEQYEGSLETQSVATEPRSELGAAKPGEDVSDMESMRRRMSEALAMKQLQKTSSGSSLKPMVSSDEAPDGGAGGVATQRTQSSDESLASGTLSTDSAKTVRAPFDMTPSSLRTPSYPFPRMQLKLHRGTSHRSGPSHKPFTLLSPTNSPLPGGQIPHATDETPTSDVSTPVQDAQGRQTLLEDHNFPTPDLYDTILVLNAEAGLDAWWANVSQVLAEAFGAERASLAIPGDMTDLENVPWGQKATFNVYGTDSVESSNLDSSTTSEPPESSAGMRESGTQRSAAAPSQTQRRPELTSRHSIAGIIPESTTRSNLQRPPGPTRAVSTLVGFREEAQRTPVSPRPVRQPLRMPSTTSTESISARPLYDSSRSGSSTLRCLVHRSLRPLESEEDALMVRTGVSQLFGKRRPVVLTRAYNDVESLSDQPNRENSRARTSGSSGASAREATALQLRAFDEYEQPEPSPWSQSPSPSPAARPDPAESPFFSTTASIDEGAFEQNPPAYDYGLTANQSLGAIGVDTSKTLVHIPLIQPLPSRGVTGSSLRFPIAILSMLSPINPYPRNLRESLTHLLPHLASSYSLAQQYTSMQDILRGHGGKGRSAAFGLGGTFSDEGSELELVAELSEQITGEKGRAKSPSAETSPSDRGGSHRDSRPGSLAGTPHLDHLGFAGHPMTPGRSGAEIVDSYFYMKRQKGSSGQQATTPGSQLLAEDSPEKSRRPEKKVQSTTRTTSRKVAAPMPKSADEQKLPIPASSASLASESDHGDSPHLERADQSLRRISQFQDIEHPSERPLPELISQLMLNSVPLQLFLAKPKSGDLVWTNRKFDAFRSQGEERVRDPWKNVHPSDRNGLVNGWNQALNSGSQFTYYARVKRFNSDSDYRWFVFRASTLLSNTGRLLYWIGSFLDVHEQYMKTLEANEKEATVARDAKLRALADSIPQVLFEAVEGEGIVAVNQQWHAYSGQTLNDARGLGFARQVHREDLHKCGVLSPTDPAMIPRDYAVEKSEVSSSGSDRTTQPIITTISHGSAWRTPDSTALNKLVEKGVISIEKDENGRLFYSTEVRLRSKGGEFRWFLVRLVKVESELINSGRTSWYGTCTDIESRKALERELSSANKKVHKEMESKTKFFANMSHEIRTPLNGILGSMPWLVESALDHDQRRTVDTIQNSSNNLRELVDNILDVTKVEAGKMALVYKWFHVRTLLEEIIDTISSRAIERGLELNYTVDANVPSSVRGDPFRLRQILLNLMGNSVKFTEQGEVYTRCYLKTPDEPDTVNPNHVLLAFEVIDTGRGFNPAEFQRIFQQFGQIDGGSSHDAGSGLGLFLSKQLVEMHGGRLSASSEAGEGSTFSFYIKAEEAAAGASATPPAQTRPSQHRASASFAGGGSPRSRSESKTPTMNWNRGPIQSPSHSSKAVASPDMQSPALLSSGSSDPSLRSQSVNLVQQSSASSILPTPEALTSALANTNSERQVLAEKAMAAVPAFRRSKSDNDGSGLAPDKAHPTTYSIVVVCPAEFARAAIKQHIEQVVPHQIAVNVTTSKGIGEFLNLVHGPASPTFTHIVLDLPHTSDVMLFLRQMTNFTAPIIPDVIVITDHYQKRDILDDFTALTATNRRAYLVHKPVKPAVFAMIFDPAQLRNLSKDAARSMAQTSSDDFKNMAARVKENIGNKNFRLLLVEDSDTNRKVILKYLTKVELLSESATDGQECTDMVLSKPHGYYNLIICDIQMPKKNGYEACKELRAWEMANRYPPLPIMALTANAMPEERAAAAQAGFTDYLTKPVNFNVLGTMMINLLDPKAPHIFLKDRPPDS